MRVFAFRVEGVRGFEVCEVMTPLRAHSHTREAVDHALTVTFSATLNKHASARAQRPCDLIHHTFLISNPVQHCVGEDRGELSIESERECIAPFESEIGKVT